MTRRKRKEDEKEHRRKKRKEKRKESGRKKNRQGSHDSSPHPAHWNQATQEQKLHGASLTAGAPAAPSFLSQRCLSLFSGLSRNKVLAWGSALSPQGDPRRI